MTNQSEGQPVDRSGVQSVSRAFDVLEALAEDGPMGLSQLAVAIDLPLTTVHRLIGSLTTLGYVVGDSTKQYSLAPRLMHLGERAGRMLSRWAVPHLTTVVDEVGETANLAMLDGDQVVYVAQVQSGHSMRMFMEVGRRVHAHCTAVGKVLLARMPADEVAAMARRSGLPAQTEHTLTTLPELTAALDQARTSGYALDEGEQEVGVRCVAVAVTGSTMPLAISVSGPAPRMTDDLVSRAVPVLTAAAASLAAELGG
jgi:IclR family transcriptional regulator, acetate operon repressor